MGRFCSCLFQNLLRTKFNLSILSGKWTSLMIFLLNGLVFHNLCQKNSKELLKHPIGKNFACFFYHFVHHFLIIFFHVQSVFQLWVVGYLLCYGFGFVLRWLHPKHVFSPLQTLPSNHNNYHLHLYWLSIPFAKCYMPFPFSCKYLHRLLCCNCVHCYSSSY